MHVELESELNPPQQPQERIAEPKRKKEVGKEFNSQFQSTLLAINVNFEKKGEI